MPRPKKWRRVCCMPARERFGPLDAFATPETIISMAVDEYETIRLIDLEGLTQEESANQMNIARTTVQRIYNDARRKLAEAIVNGRVLAIGGGDVEIYCNNRGSCCRPNCETGSSGPIGSK